MTFTKQQILAAEEQLYKSIKACDVESLDDILHEDLLFNNHFGQTLTKQIDLDIYKSGNLVVSELIPGECQINFYRRHSNSYSSDCTKRRIYKTAF